MKHTFWMVVVALLVPTAADANVRAPIEEDGDIVIAKLASEASAQVTLKKQKLVIAMPQLIEKKFTSIRASIEATYTFENTGDAVSIPVIFLATDIHDAVVTVNGEQAAGPAEAIMNPAQRDELQQAVDVYAKPPANRSKRKLEGKTATFEMRLAPGENTVVFRYEQLTAFNEGGTRYGGPKHDRSGMGLNYLLYPCKAWNKATDFALDVEVRMPDFLKTGWFWDTHWAPDITTNLSLTPTYDEKARMTTLRGTFQGYPQDVLSVNVRRGDKR